MEKFFASAKSKNASGGPTSPSKPSKSVYPPDITGDGRFGAVVTLRFESKAVSSGRPAEHKVVASFWGQPSETYVALAKMLFHIGASLPAQGHDPQTVDIQDVEVRYICISPEGEVTDERGYPVDPEVLKHALHLPSSELKN